MCIKYFGALYCLGSKECTEIRRNLPAWYKLIQDGFAIAVTVIEGVGGYVGVQPLCGILHVSTPLHQ